MDYSEAANRISRKFAQGEKTPDVKKIEGKLKRLVDEFGVQPSEAERSVTSELAKEYNLPTPGSGGSAGAGGSSLRWVAKCQPAPAAARPSSARLSASRAR